MKVCLLVLFLTSTILAIKTSRATAQSASKYNSLDLHYYRQYKENQHNLEKEAREAKEAAHVHSPADTFHQQQDLRTDAFKLKQEILDVQNKTKLDNHNAQHEVDAIKTKIHDFAHHQEHTGDQGDEESQQLKYKINHNEKFRQVYEHRAEENAASAMTKIAPAAAKDKQDLAKWDHKQEEHYAGKAHHEMDELTHNKKGEEDDEKGITNKLADMQNELEKARKDREALLEKGAQRLEKLNEKLAVAESRLSNGLAVSNVTAAVSDENKALAQEKKPVHMQGKGRHGKGKRDDVDSISFSTPVKSKKVKNF